MKTHGIMNFLYKSTLVLLYLLYRLISFGRSFISYSPQNTHRIQIKRITIKSGQDIEVFPEKTIIVKRIHNLEKILVVNKAKKNHIADLVLASSLTSKSVCSSKNSRHVVGRPIIVEMIVYDNLEGLITQGHQFSIHLAS